MKRSRGQLRVPDRQPRAKPVRGAWIGVLLVGLLAAACGDQVPVPPRSLASPAGFAVARSCVAMVDGVELRVEPERCDEGADLAEGLVQSLGLLANRERQALTLFAMDGSRPALVDTDITEPGVTGIAVCDGPRRVAVTPDGTFALALCDIDQVVSVVAVPLRREVGQLRREEPEVALVAAPDAPLFAFARPESAVLRIERLTYTCAGVDEGFPADCSPDVTVDLEAEVALPGRPEDVAFGAGGRLYVSYQDRAFVSGFELGSDTTVCLDEEAEPPCETLRVGVAEECADGVDNDGDGAVDRDDPQCFGPLGAESPDGLRGVLTACTDGVDTDGDGLIDHGDPDCLSELDDNEGGGVLSPACANGLDDDGDGLVDAADPECAVTGWHDESRAPACADGVDNDDDGDVDGDDADCLTELWDDEGRAPDPGAACSNGLDDDGDGFADRADPGCGGPADDSETAAAPVCADGADNDGDGLTDIDDPDCYGPTGDTELGFASDGFGPLGLVEGERYLLVGSPTRHELRIVDVQEGRLLDTGAGDFLHTGLGVRVSNAGVLGPPAGYAVEATVSETETATTGVVQTIAVSPVSDGFAVVVDLDTTVFTASPGGDPRDEGFKLRLRPRDGDPSSAETGAFECDIPDDYRDRVREQRGPDAPLGVGCTDVEMAQLAAIDGEERVRLVQEERFNLEDEALVAESVPFDWRLRDETWTLTFEGVVTDSDRDDGLIDADVDGLVVSQGVNFCNLGVVAGDHLVIAEATPALDAEPDACADFADVGLEYAIDFVRADAVYLATLDEEGLAARLPTRECFSEGFEYVIRVDDEWLVTGSSSDTLHDRTGLSQQCVDRRRDPLRTARLHADEPFQNVFFEVLLASGTVEPTRGFSVSFAIENHFAVSALDTGPLPTAINLAQTAGGRRLSIADGGVNRLFVFDADTLTSLANIF